MVFGLQPIQPTEAEIKLISFPYARNCISTSNREES